MYHNSSRHRGNAPLYYKLSSLALYLETWYHMNIWVLFVVPHTNKVAKVARAVMMIMPSPSWIDDSHQEFPFSLAKSFSSASLPS